MSTQIQRRRGTTAQHASFTGAIGETTIDTDKEVVVVHDGSTVGGNPLMREDASNSALALGSAAAPSLKFTGDTNTGIYSPGADQVAISTSGAQRLLINSSGAISAGGSISAAGGLNVSGAGWGVLPYVANSLVIDSTAGQTRLFATGTDASTHGNLLFFTGTTNGTASERLRITSAGLVGVGVSGPSSRLHVRTADGTATTTEVSTIVRDNSGYFLKLFRDAGSGNTGGLIGADSAGTYYTGGHNTSNMLYIDAGNSLAQIYTNSNARLTIDSSGRCGIGTSSPAALTHLSNTSSTAGYNFFQITAGSESQVHTIKSTISTGRDLEVNSARTLKFTTGSNTGAFASEGHFQFSHGTNGDLVRITADGKVGIGTATPANKLDVNGSISATGTLFNTGFAPSVHIGLSGGNPSIASGNNVAATFLPLVFRQETTTGASEAMRIDPSGRLLVGTSSARDTGVASAPNIGATFEKGGGYNTIAVVGNTNGADGAYISLLKSRGTTTGATTIVSSEDYLGSISFEGTDGTNPIIAAQITCRVDGTPGTNDMPGRLVFSTTADGASSPSERWRIDSGGSLVGVAGSAFVAPYVYNTTTATAANVNVDATGFLRRSTSSIKYKTNVETIQDQYADAILGCRPVWYQSTCEADKPEWGHWGFIAEEVAAIDPRLCFFKEEEDGTLEPEGVQYDRFVPHLLNLIKRQGEAIADLQAEVSALKGA